jgi:hypothetical protein
MSDDWSLKDKSACCGGYGTIECLQEEFFYYKTEDIETLRQKLIDDITWCLGQKDFTNEWNNPMLGLIISKINKRFGVEE